MEIRLVTQGDVDAILHGLDGLGPVPRRQHSIEEWHQLYAHQRPFGVVAATKSRVAALMIGTFIQARLYELAVQREHPYLSALMADYADDDGYFAPDPDRKTARFAEANRSGLYLVLYAFAGPGSETLDDSYVSRTLVAEAFLERFRGANIKGLLMEAMNDGAERARQLGLEELNSYPAFRADSQAFDGLAVYGLTRERAALSTNHFLARLLLHESPTTVMGARLRRLLYHASHGRSDPWIAEQMGLSTKSLKTYWDRIFEAFERSRPGSVYDGYGSRREAVLGHVRAHPAERWPI